MSTKIKNGPIELGAPILTVNPVPTKSEEAPAKQKEDGDAEQDGNKDGGDSVR